MSTTPPEAKRLPLTTVGRPIDLRYPTNLAIVLLTLVTFAAGIWTMTMRGESFVASVPHSLAWAGTVFLSWALAREVDPDRWYSAFFAAAGGFIAASMYAPPPLLAIFWFLLALRFINRSTGYPPGLLDMLGLCVISAWLGWTTHWTFPWLSLPVLLFTGQRPRPATTQIVFGAAIAAAGIAVGIANGWVMPLSPIASSLEAKIIIAITLACTFVIRSYHHASSLADRTGERLEPKRIQWALVWGLSVGIILTFGAGVPLLRVSPLWAALAGAFVGWGFQRLWTHTKNLKR